jgi:hypothetical protein
MQTWELLRIIMKILRIFVLPGEKSFVYLATRRPNVEWLRRIYTRVALYIMPPVYFHGNYNRYRVQNNALG